MKRRTLLQAVPAAGLLSLSPFTARSSGGSWRTFEVVTRVEVAAPTGQVMVWVPLPLSQDTDWFQTLGNSATGNFTVNNDVIEPNYRAAIGAATFKPSEAQPVFEVTSRFRTRDRNVEFRPGAGMLASAAEQATYLKPTEFMPTDGIVRDTALKVTKGARTDVDKARAIYDWTVENTERNPKTRGCGVGDIKAMLESNNLNGKCADLNALFVALARARSACLRATCTACASPIRSAATRVSASPATSRGRSIAAPSSTHRTSAGFRSTLPTYARSYWKKSPGSRSATMSSSKRDRCSGADGKATGSPTTMRTMCACRDRARRRCRS